MDLVMCEIKSHYTVERGIYMSSFAAAIFVASLATVEVAVSQDGCQATIPLFLGHLGLYIEGSVSPPLADVYIRIIAGADSQNAPTKPAEVVLETTTGEDGVFIGGPLYDDITYNVEASKEYAFSPAA